MAQGQIIGDPVRIELTDNGLITYLVNHFATWCGIYLLSLDELRHKARIMGHPEKIKLTNNVANYCIMYFALKTKNSLDIAKGWKYEAYCEDQTYKSVPTYLRE